MRVLTGSRFAQILAALLMIALVSACAPSASTESAATTTPDTETPAAPASAVATSAPEGGSATPGAVPVSSSDVLYQDDFRNPSTGWPEARFDNYFIGYHEPEYYHIEIDGPNYRAPVFAPGKRSFGDATMQLKVQVNSKKTAASGDFLYGLVFRRSGDQYYAFTVSSRSRKWMFLKSSPTAVTTLAEGADSSLHPADVDDLLQVDAQGSAFSLHVNDHVVAQVTDADYAGGEVGLYVQSLDSAQVHVHFDDLVIRNYAALQPSVPQTATLYHDNFTNPSTGWPEAKFDNYFIGYHEPEYYHIEIDSPNYRTAIFAPGKKSFGDATLQLSVQVSSKKTAAKGDVVYGIAFRRSGDQYYAFVVSSRSQKWMFLKSSPSALTTLSQGTDASLHSADADDLLRVDAQGSTFSLHVNGRLVGQVSDADYASGEVGLYVQTFDIVQAHVHFDSLTISDFEAPLLCKVAAGGTGLNLRSGPGTDADFIFSLPSGEVVEPLGHSRDGQWLNVRVEASGQAGWVNSAGRFVNCNRDIAVLPVIIP